MRRALPILLLALGFLVLSSETWELRKSQKALAEELKRPDRFVDMTVLLRVVEHDPDGIEYLPGKPRLRVLREHTIGGIVDTAQSPPAFCGVSEAPVVWYCSAASEPIILHDDALPSRIMEEGAMGAGKTTDMAQWLGVRGILFTGQMVEMGGTAPTTTRLGEFKRAVMDLWPRSWWRWKERDQTFTLANGVVLRMVSTHQASATEGSPIQGFNWAAVANDELQDSTRVDGDIEARGRDAPENRYYRFATVTLKDDAEWREFRDRVRAEKHPKTGAAMWHFVRKAGVDSPFIDADWWEQLRSRMTEDEYARKALAEDRPSADLLYGREWSHADNIRPIPVMGAKDVTAVELARFGYGNCAILGGHDPGETCHATELLKAYQFPNERDPVWFVVGEVVTDGTTEAHGIELADFVKTRWGHQTGSVVLHIDPHSNGAENDSDRPDLTVTRRLQNMGFVVRQAAYQEGKAAPARIGRTARADMVRTLLKSALIVRGANHRRLFVACDPQTRVPVAKRLVEAFESLKKGADHNGKKGKGDKTHFPAALGYALWKIEKPRLDAGRRTA